MTQRLDRELARRGLVRSRSRAQDAIRGGGVRVNSVVVTRPAEQVAADDIIELQPDPYVSRAGHKLAGALAASGVRVPARVLDAGASTGGFTQVLLQAGAQRVYAVDVGHGQLVPELRADPRVVVRERLNLRDLALTDLDSMPVGLVVADVAFISLTLLLRPLFAVLDPTGTALLLVKPQFEVGRAGLDDRGVVRDERLRAQAIARVVHAAAELGWEATWQFPSELPGESGNVEYFVRFDPSASDVGGSG